jgi:DNA polymerase-1
MQNDNVKNHTFVLVDGSAYLFRAFHALPPLTSSKGEPTGAVYGVVAMLKKLMVEMNPHYIAVVFDTKEPTFRHEMYKEYKANRTETPPELIGQFPILINVIKAMGLPVLQIVGVEADDVIGTLAVMAKKEGWDTIVSTSDKDLAQLVNNGVKLINTMTDTVLDEKGVMEKFGVKPDQIIDYLALMGDTSDNVPGIPKVGPKTAAKWLAEYGTLDNVIKNADKIAGKVGESLRENLHILSLSKELVTIKLDVPLSMHVTDLHKKPADNAELSNLYQHLEFKKWLAELSNVMPEAKPQEKTSEKKFSYTTILDKKTLTEWTEKLKIAGTFAVDTETTSLNPNEAELVGIALAIHNEAAYIPLAHNYLGAPEQLELKWVLDQLKPILEDKKLIKVAQNVKYDWSILIKYGIDLSSLQFDTMLESYVYNSVASRHDMDSLAQFYLHKKTITYEEVAGKGAKQIGFEQVAIDVAAEYAAEDTEITLQLHEFLWPELKSMQGPQEVFTEIEMPLAMVLARMEQRGVLIDADLLKKQSQELAIKIQQLEKDIFKTAGTEFNISSPKQLQEVLFEKLKLPSTTKTPTGQPSTAEAVLQELALEYPLPAEILQYRSLSKLKSTYTDSLPEQIDPLTGRVHTSYHQAVTATGRLSSSDPNLQNIPIRTEEGRRIRQAFIAPKGYKVVAADYSQIELRIMAHLSNDPGLCKAFAQGLDIHRATAAEVFGVTLEKVTDEQRRHAKAINFGLIYGMSAFGLSKQIGTGREIAQEYIKNYFLRYPGVQGYMEKTRKEAASNGYVSTLFGRRLYLPEINSKNHLRKMAAERTAINAPMQGTAADIIKRAMITMHDWLDQHPEVGHMVMQVHDELVFEVDEKQIDFFMPKLHEIMTNAAEMRVPLVIGVGIGKNWDEAH